MTSATKPLRADAERNRVRVVIAARELFASHGLDVTLDDVARHAGVGVGTVYRRFPNKEALVLAVFDHVLDELVEHIDAAVAEPDAWVGLSRLITDIAEKQAADRGLYEICTRADFGQMERISAHFIPTMEALVSRAKEQGALRPDFEAPDIGPLLIMVAASAELTRAIDPDLWRRYLTMLLDGIRAGCSSPLRIDAPTHEQMDQAMRDKHA
ncbi:Transcriptional regulator, TetR family [Alloactinosynnema sp. L-07]|uniref:TetR/AcrR family transcriptional regulator n=1 Tax=Alloactinosynnema sp. L-07 TaxID=1653480 RepID=UPI00065EFFE9|nr:TetR/AcrR family transcriptional regulator [Alloactinosynnema sp. L-07]CRK59625.1 Transcriptional regulator, TetR family [Alloactinosynnema sp. L-07]